MGRKCAKRVSLRGSALFKLTSPARLAHILCISPGQLAYLVRNAESNYLVRTDRKTKRLIEEPKALLKQIHARVAHLLQQIETPDYLHSGVRQRSYVTNASQHRADEGAIKLDVRKFFPSARAAAVYAFFHEVMEYPPDVASRMTKLLTIAGHLPTGGNASCILSFWAYRPMFDEIAALGRTWDEQYAAEFFRQAEEMHCLTEVHAVLTIREEDRTREVGLNMKFPTTQPSPALAKAVLEKVLEAFDEKSPGASLFGIRARVVPHGPELFRYDLGPGMGR